MSSAPRSYKPNAMRESITLEIKGRDSEAAELQVELLRAEAAERSANREIELLNAKLVRAKAGEKRRPKR